MPSDFFLFIPEDETSKASDERLVEENLALKKDHRTIKIATNFVCEQMKGSQIDALERKFSLKIECLLKHRSLTHSTWKASFRKSR